MSIARRLLLLAPLLLLGQGAFAQQPDEAFAICLDRPGDQAAAFRKLQNCNKVLARPNEDPRKRAYAFAMRGWFGTTPAERIADFSAALEVLPDLDQALAGRASAYLNSGASDKAVLDYTRILSRHPDDVYLLTGRGDAYNNLARYDEALVDFDRALTIEPDNDEVLNDRAWALARHKRLPEAIEGYSRALSHVKIMPADTILGNRCDARSMSGDLAGALTDCNAAIQAKLDHAGHLATRGYAHLRAGRLQDAAADFEASLAKNPKDTGALFGRGVLRLQSGAKEEGLADIAAAEQIFPRIRSAMAQIGIEVP